MIIWNRKERLIPFIIHCDMGEINETDPYFQINHTGQAFSETIG